MRSFSSTAPTNVITQHVRALVRLTFALMLAALTLATPGAGVAQANDATPTTSGIAFLQSSGTLIVRGEGFTPGGRVQIVISDHQDNSLHPTVWTSAATGSVLVGHPGYEAPGTFVLVMHLQGVDGSGIYSPEGIRDPADRFRRGISTIGLISAGSVNIRVHDETATTWSAIALVNPDAALASSPTRPDQTAGPRTCSDVLLCQQ